MLAVARALARHPKLLLLDELSLGLAPVIVEWLLPVVRQFAQERDCAVLLVEQHVHLALEVADRGYVLSHGRIVLHNDAEHLRANRQLLIASYLGEQSSRDAVEPTRGRTIVSHGSLEDLLASVESPVELLRNSQAGPNVYPGVPAEFTNWRDEQTAWQQTCVLFNQSYHMADLAVEGPDALELLSRLAVNSFEGFAVDKAKHFVPCTPDGYVIGDVILFHLAENRFNLVGRAPGAELDHVPRRDGRLRRAGRARPAERAAQRRAPQVLPVPGAGPERDAGDREGARRAAAGAEVLQHDDGDDRGQHRPRPSPRHGRPAGLGAVRAVGRRRGRARGDRGRGRGVRAQAGRRPGLLVEHARVGLDPVAAPGRVLRARA